MKFKCIVSEEVPREAAQGDPQMSRERLKALEGIPVMAISAKVEALSTAFLKTGALPESMRSDALHLAAATLGRADFLLTWNCRHLANAHVLKRMRKEAERQGWTLPIVCTPVEMMGDYGP